MLDLALLGRDHHAIDATVVAFQEDGLFRRQFSDAGVPTRFLDKDPGVTPELVFRLRRAVREFDVDVVHAHHFGPLLYGGIAARTLGVPVVYTEHSREVYDTARRRALARALSRIAAVVTVSAELRDWWKDALGVDVRLILNGVQVDEPPTESERRAARRRLGLPDAAFVVGCTARLAPEKDLATLIRAVARLPGARLVVAGAGPSEGELQALVRQLGVDERVTLLGVRHDIPLLLPAYDVVALSSLREGLPMALLEGMARARPVVATDVGEIGALVGDGCGTVVPVGDVAAFADALAAYRDDPERIRRAGARAHAKVRAGYSARAMARAYAELYAEALASVGRR